MNTAKQRKYRKPEKAEAILIACSKLVANQGYAEVSMKNIADEAGVYQSLLHYYFKNKENLFIELFRFLNRKYLDIMSDVASLPVCTAEKLEAAFCEFQKFTRREPKWMIMILDLIIQSTHKPESKAEVLSFYKSGLELTIKGLSNNEGSCEAAVPEVDREVLSALLIATLMGMGLLFTIDEDATDFSKAWSYYKKMLLSILQEPDLETEQGMEGTRS